jgi:hypothetical protein
MKAVRMLAGMVALLATAGGAAGQEPAGGPQVTPGGQVSITLRGFIGVTAFLQDNTFGFGNGQNAAWSAPDGDGSRWILSGDVRNVRLGLDLKGPAVGGGWRAAGVIEMDFFGGFAGFPGGVSALTDEQPLPRLRLAYADLARGRTTVRLGQYWSPLFGYVPASVSHLSFPLGYGSAGNIGWRFPGLFVYHTLTAPESATRVQLQAAAMRGSWWAPAAETVNHLSPGETSGFPQLEGRLDVGGRRAGGLQWGAYVAGHYDRRDLRPYGAGGRPSGDERLDGTALAAGFRLVPGRLTLQGGGYRGRAMGHALAHITQPGDIGGWGGWGQAGLALDPHWSVWAFYGIDRPDVADVRASFPASSARLRNDLASTMIRYGSGPYQLGVEWLRAETDWWLPAGSPRERRGTGNQYSMSMILSF